MEDKGTEPECSGWCFVDAEAECSDEGNDFGELFENSSEHLSMIDDSPQEQGESLQLMNELDTERDAAQLADLKRKYLPSPLSREVDDTLSPRLEKVSLTPRKSKKVKKVLFNDSGLAGESFAESTPGPSQAGLSTSNTDTVIEEHSSPVSEGAAAAPPEDAAAAAARRDVTMLLKSSNAIATLHAKFKAVIGASFSEITRKYSSDRTMSEKWCICIYGICEPIFDTVKPLMQEYCEFMCLRHYAHEEGQLLLGLFEFKAQKCRATIHKLLKTLLLVQPDQMLLEPPRTRSAATALFWYKQIALQPEQTVGDTPDWIASQVLVAQVTCGGR